MPEITILLSEIQEYEIKIAAQQEIIKLQAQLLVKMREVMVLAGILPAQTETAESAGN